jgi:EmrB/QacA subfamily drug resistance transporter
MSLFDASLSSVQWITTGYLLALAVLLPIMGKLGDRYGQGRIHNAGYVLFTISSVAAALSSDLTALLTMRVAQAAGAAMFQATNMALVVRYAPPNRKGKALGAVSSAVALGAMAGPVAGGFIADGLGWQWLFLAHVPFAGAATWLAYRYVPARPAEPVNSSLNAVGGGLMAAVICAFIFIIASGQTLGWTSGAIVAALLAGSLALVGFVLREKRHPHPFLPLEALRQRTVSVGLLASVGSFALANTMLAVMPFFLTGYAGRSSAEAGLMMLAYPAMLALSGPAAGRLSDRIGARAPMLLGLGAMAVGTAFLALLLASMPFGWLAVGMGLTGLGMGLIAAPNNSFILRHAPAKQSGATGGLIALSRNAGLVIGSALGLGMIGASAEMLPPNAIRGALAFAAAIGVGCGLTLLLGVRTKRAEPESGGRESSRRAS